MSIDSSITHEFLGAQWREVDQFKYLRTTDVRTIRMYPGGDGITGRYFAEVLPLPTEPGMYVDADGEFWRLSDAASVDPLRWMSWAGMLSSTPNPVGLRRMEPVT